MNCFGGIIYAFLEFSITFVLDGLRKGMTLEQISGYMENYVLAENDAKNETVLKRCRMIKEVLLSILSGENPELVKELIASYLGKELRSKFMNEEEGKLAREEILECYKTKAYTCSLLEELADAEDAVLQTVIRNTDNVTLATALAGASGVICVRFLKNLSDRLMYFVHEDIRAVQADEAEMREAQRCVLALAK